MDVFGEYLESFLPPYLTDTQKSRLKVGLLQFSVNRGEEKASAEIDYSNFTSKQDSDYFKQSDIVREIRYPFLNGNYDYEKKYTDAIILSNTCDVSDENPHNLNEKQAVFAPIIKLDLLLEELNNNSDFSSDQIRSFQNELKLQRISNLFYINDNGENEFVAILDKIFWFPTKELNEYLENISDNKIFSLTMFGYYLYLLKVSFHFCRFPESLDRMV